MALEAVEKLIDYRTPASERFVGEAQAAAGRTRALRKEVRDNDLSGMGFNVLPGGVMDDLNDEQGKSLSRIVAKLAPPGASQMSGPT